MTILTTMTFDREGYDSFIDFLKGFSILSIVLTHNLPMGVKDWTLFYTWGIQAVPIFLLIQVFHAYKKGFSSRPHYNITKLFKRIILPFAFVQSIYFASLLISGGCSKEQIVAFIVSGGYGRGSYYVWIYLQFFFLLPAIGAILSKSSNYKIGGVKYYCCPS